MRVRLAVETGHQKYWEDTRAQSEAYKRWRERGFQGKCEQFTKGSIIDYITREVMAMLNVGAG